MPSKQHRDVLQQITRLSPVFHLAYFSEHQADVYALAALSGCNDKLF